jgi:DNA-binding transcriptional MerR regulator
MKNSKRQERWKELGISEEGIQNHLYWERKKSKEARERRKKNNEDNKDLIKRIKKDLLGQTFKLDDSEVKILSINPSVDGVGFWYKINRKFSDGSEGEFRYFYDFKDYSKKEFITWLKY